MSLKSTESTYGRVAQLFHWSSAFLILLMIPLGFLMQSADAASKQRLYQLHVVLGILILLLTLLRIVWRWREPTPQPPAGLSPLHQFAFKAVHLLLYVVLLLISVSGIGLMLMSGLAEPLFSGAGSFRIPADLAQLPPRLVHSLTAKLYMGLLIAHIGGVMLHQFSQSNVLRRMGINLPERTQTAN